jgi:hypothetical protein
MSRQTAPMSRFRTTIFHKSLVVGVLCFFAFARVAFGGEVCSFGSGGCLPPAIGVAAHGLGHDHGQVCAIQTVSSQSFSTIASWANVLNAVAPTIAVALTVPLAIETPRPLRGERTAGAASPLVTSGRLRL